MTEGAAACAVIFDCDGVLVDTERISVRVGAAIFGELGWSLSEEEFAARFVGCSREHFDREAAAGLGRPLPPDWHEPYADRYAQAFAEELTPVDGVVALLDHLAGAGVPLAVASNSPQAHVRSVLALTGLAGRFGDRLFTAEQVSRGKPAPDVYLAAAAAMQLPPACCTVVEDSPHGVRAALAAGMTCFAYAGGVTPAERLAGLGAEVFCDMRELIARLPGEARRRSNDSDSRSARP